MVDEVSRRFIAFGACAATQGSRCAGRFSVTIYSHAERHDLMGHAHLAGDHGCGDTLLEQVRGTHQTLLHRPRVAPRTHSSAARPCQELLANNP
jgi:hypothetical protein